MSKSIDTSHVRNVGEFYSQHYLDAVLPEDLQPVLDRWVKREDEGGAKTPERRLAALAEPYFKAMAEHAAEDDAGRRAEIAAGFHARLIEALGYERAPQGVVLPDGRELPVAVALSLQGKPYLWIAEAGFPASEDDADPLGAVPLRLGAGEDGESDGGLPPWRELLDGPVLRQEHAPRWVMLLAGPDAFLVDRDKWALGQYLAFEVGAMLGQRKPAALRALAGLLHREVLLPEGGRSLLDEIDEKSHKHAFAVSTDLKYGVQKAIELIGNEVIHYQRERLHERLYDRPELARELSRECITYLYRLLFLFYVEARGGEVGVVPMKAEAYRQGLSLESLRELELVPLTTERARNGYFIHHSLTKLFEVVHLGWPVKRQRDIGAQYADSVDLTVPPQRSPLFDKARTPLISPVKLRNFVLQEVIRLLSLSKEGKRGGGAAGRQRGRISYAQLGINQLGAVYEGLLSYTGFFTQEETFEVCNPKEKDEDARVYYVGKSKIDDYREDEFRKTKSGKKISYPKGTFLFRLAGRDREKSASYYTPEVLTKCLTKYTLKERLGVMGEPGALSADEILELTVCEPAMGSGAFLNEAVGQLAHAYLERKQAELGVQIPAEEYQREWAKVKYHFVVHNCYGVDLNPLAAELGKVSLWLGVLQPGVQAPYLDLRIRVGNSLIGARREVYSADDLMRKANKKTGEVSWLEKAPDRVKPGEKRPEGSVYHFLVPDEGMSPYEKDKVVAGLCPEQIEALKKWRKEMKQPFTRMEVKRLQGISDRIDDLWEEHRRVRNAVLNKARQPIKIWGQHNGDATQHPAAARWKTAEECEVAARELWKPSSPGARLKAIMDYWCGLWTWPAEETLGLPSRESWLTWVEETLERGTAADPRAEDGRFQHWELEFPEVFATRGGFDVVLGNPPWIKVILKDESILAEVEPWISWRISRAKSIVRLATEGDNTREKKKILTDEHSAERGASAALHSLYPNTQGTQANLYKIFIALSWQIGNGAIGLIHEPGVLDDPASANIRTELFRRLRMVARFKNDLKLFAEISNQRPYCLTVSSTTSSEANFISFSSLLHPSTIESSITHDGIGPIPGLRGETSWNLEGHKNRAVVINSNALEVLCKIFAPEENDPYRAPLPAVYAQELVAILSKIGRAPRLGDDPTSHQGTREWHEGDRQNDNTLTPDNHQPSSLDDLIVSGPHFFVAEPFAKSPRVPCNSNRDYTRTDWQTAPDDFVPRSLYRINRASEAYAAKLPTWNNRSFFGYNRHVHREMVGPFAERTLIPAILPAGPQQLGSVLALAFSDPEQLLIFSAIASSIVADFVIKTLGVAHINLQTSRQLPSRPIFPGTTRYQIARTLRLNCTTSAFSDIWKEGFPLADFDTGFATSDRPLEPWNTCGSSWSRNACLRTPLSRRQALLELDALAALGMGLSLDELLLIYRVQFPVLRQYENETFYDQRGKIVFTVNRGLAGVGLTRDQWTQIKDARAGDPLPDFARDAGGPFVPPFDRCDREADMAQAYAYFQKLLS